MKLSEFDLAVLAAITWQQPITRDRLKVIFGKDISHDLIGWLFDRAMIATGPRALWRGAPYTFVTTDAFLAAVGLESLDCPPEAEQRAEAGFAVSTASGGAGDLPSL